MSFNKYATLDSLDDSKIHWKIRVRAQAIWQGLNIKTKEFRGLNVIFIDDCNHRIHGFIAAPLCPKHEANLKEGGIYIVSNFLVKYYNGDETYRAIRTVKHIYFNNDTKLTKDSGNGLKIQPQCFDLFCLTDIDKLKNDNRFLIDVVGVIDDVPTKLVYKKEDGDRFNVKFNITYGRCYVNVTFFNDFGQKLLNALNEKLEEPVIIIIASARINEWNDQISLINYPATRFYLNSTHHSVKKMRKRLLEGSFYASNLDDENEEEVPFLTVKELLKVNEDYIQKQVQCKVTIKKIDQKLKWYCNYCIKCDVDLQLVDGNYKCPTCGKAKPYPDKRYQLSTLCSDSTGTIPILWEDEELIRLTGKTVYDLLADETQVGDGDNFPPLLKQFEKKCYNIIVTVKEENVKQGSNVYTANKISNPEEMSATHSPNTKMEIKVKQTEISNETNTDKISPPTGKSTNKNRARKYLDPVQCEISDTTPVAKFKSIKTEKLS